ncbi:MAG: pyridoxal phosphate-dependent aminotransferase [Saprospiraceae bacterium]|nr:pyridoxal phosphate-dependent aminotransferase [Saprospiraceae bacterium]
MPSSSQRGSTVPLSPIRKFAVMAEKAKAQGKQVYHLNIGQPDIETPAAALDKLKSLDVKILEYSPAEGIASYRQKLTEYYKKYNIEVDAEQVIVTTGASEGLYFVLLACLEAGEEVIVPEPFYANYNGFAHMAGVKIQPITSYIEDGFALPNAAAFEDVITDKTRAILLCNPNNPTGCLYDRASLEGLAALARKYDLFLIVDEVYREFYFDNQEFTSILNIADIEDHAIVIDSVSKRYSACGARIGALVTRNKSVLDAVSRFAKLRLGSPTLEQYLAEAMLDADESYLEMVKSEYDLRRKTVYNRLSQMPGVVCYLPGGAFYSFAQFPIDNADRFCQWLLEDFDYQGATVMLSPGAAFYTTPGLGMNEVRLAYVINAQKLEAAMDCLERALEIYPEIIYSQEKNVFNIFV